MRKYHKHSQSVTLKLSICVCFHNSPALAVQAIFSGSVAGRIWDETVILHFWGWKTLLFKLTCYAFSFISWYIRSEWNPWLIANLPMILSLVALGIQIYFNESLVQMIGICVSVCSVGSVIKNTCHLCSLSSVHKLKYCQLSLCFDTDYNWYTYILIYKLMQKYQ